MRLFTALSHNQAVNNLIQNSSASSCYSWAWAWAAKPLGGVRKRAQRPLRHSRPWRGFVQTLPRHQKIRSQYNSLDLSYSGHIPVPSAVDTGLVTGTKYNIKSSTFPNPSFSKTPIWKFVWNSWVFADILESIFIISNVIKYSGKQFHL